MQKATYVMIFKRVTSRLQPLIKLTPSFTVNRNNTIKQHFYWEKQVIISTVQTIPKWRNGGYFKMVEYQYIWNSKMASKSNMAAIMKCQLIPENIIMWRQHKK